MASEQLLTCKDVAQILRIHEKSLLNPKFRERLGLPVIRIGRVLRFRTSDIEALIERGLDNGE